MDIMWFVSPVVGCIIGYITNYIAIKMLFRPHDPIVIRGKTLPFTPGLIPKNRDRLAAAIGDVISRELLNADVIEATLLSDDMKARAEAAIDGAIAHVSNMDESLEDVLKKTFGEEMYTEQSFQLKSSLTDALSEKLIEADLGTIAARAITDYALRKSPSALQGLVSGLLDEKKRHTVTGQLREGINHYVEANAQEMVFSALDEQANKLLTAPIGEAVQKYEDKLLDLKRFLMDGYERAVKASAAKALGALDISTIVRERISTFDSRTLEKLVLSVMNRELKAIVWLGALLGFIMGFTNMLFV